MTGAPTISWLMAGDPSVRWQVLRDLPSVPERGYERERARIAKVGWGRRLLDPRWYHDVLRALDHLQEARVKPDARSRRRSAQRRADRSSRLGAA